MLDIQMRKGNRHIILLIDNFSGHYIEYEPRYIRLEYFKPNLTPYVQPCDAGIIRCLKAYYRRSQCLRAIELDEADEHNIYKMNLLEAMLMVKDAWENVTPETIAHCWDHTGIQKKSAPSVPSSQTDAVQSHTSQGWNVIREFATTPMSLPQAEEKLKAIFGAAYKDADWRQALDCVLEAENDETKALEAVEKLTQQIDAPNTTTPALSLTSPTTIPASPQLAKLEETLLKSVDELKTADASLELP